MSKITAEQARAVEILLVRGQSQRVVSISTGVSRGCVAKIAAGKWAPRGKKKPTNPNTEAAVGSIGRCPTCRAKVYLPCRACALRESMEQRGNRRRTSKCPN